MIEQHFKKVNVRKSWVVHGYGGKFNMVVNREKLLYFTHDVEARF